MPAKKSMPTRDEFVAARQARSDKQMMSHFQVGMSTIKRWAEEFQLPPKARVVGRDSKVPDVDDLVIGSLLGDGCLTKRYKPIHNSKFTELHGLPQLKYLEHKREALSFFNPTDIRHGMGVNPHTGEPNPNVVFTTKTHPYFTKLETEWYARDQDGNYILKNNTRIKIVPKTLKLTPKMVAYWFCDDGCNTAQTRQASFSTDGFTWEECNYLANELRQLGVSACTVAKTNRKNQFKILVGSSSFLDFIDMIDPFVPECMKYKTDKSKYTTPMTFVGEDGVNSKLTNNQVERIFQLRSEGLSHREIGLVIGSTTGAVQCILSGATWKHLGLKSPTLSIDQRQRIRQSTITKAQVDQIIALNNQKMRGSEIARQLKIPNYTVWNVLDRTVWADYTKDKTIISMSPTMTKENALEIIRLHNEGIRQAEISRRTGTNKGTINDILHGRTWTKLGVYVRPMNEAPALAA